MSFNKLANRHVDEGFVFSEQKTPAPLLYQKPDERLRILCGSGRYEIVKRFQREDQKWPFCYLLISTDRGNTFHLFTRQRVG